MVAGPPPLLRDDRLTLEQLGRMACEFDQISRGEHWPATRFVEWLRDEYRATAEAERPAEVFRGGLAGSSFGSTSREQTQTDPPPHRPRLSTNGPAHRIRGRWRTYSPQLKHR